MRSALLPIHSRTAGAAAPIFRHSLTGVQGQLLTVLTPEIGNAWAVINGWTIMGLLSSGVAGRIDGASFGAKTLLTAAPTTLQGTWQGDVLQLFPNFVDKNQYMQFHYHDGLKLLRVFTVVNGAATLRASASCTAALGDLIRVILDQNAKMIRVECVRGGTIIAATTDFDAAGFAWANHFAVGGFSTTQKVGGPIEVFA